MTHALRARHPRRALDLPVVHRPGQSGERTVTVQRGDTLSQIAQEELGNPSRYTQIFDASRATTQATPT
jgi:nucleoid-associated protein YgaU